MSRDDKDEKQGHHHHIAIFFFLCALGALGVSYFSTPGSTAHHHGGIAGTGFGGLASLTAIRGVLVAAEKLLCMLALVLALAATVGGGWWLWQAGIIGGAH
jgi:hypothetical protein